MAKPISIVKKRLLTEEELQERTILQLKQQLAESNEALEKSLSILNELHKSGILEAAESLLQARANIAEIALGQVSRPEVTNLINHGMAAAGALTSLDPAHTKSLIDGLKSGISEAQTTTAASSKTSLWSMSKSLRDPDILRALSFGLSFLKGLGRSLKNPNSPHN